ncbi:hypothetical protein SEA_VINCENZO_85 [Mycobacterium phage Vincenzo]|uniref:HicA-like toxin n=2 Tax=Coopervirus vincenzo TaxID=1983110 RepID=A0A0F6SJJ9_9CAUD|nr:hypothetical protein SEA_VINCENZO_85 [Mycobacterium phage Vincenzo]AKF14347.1 hypothetical protein SEA_VINCENZO_85 [Mycobacterium phage Vincenzo]AKF14751.1 hypothetical protein SEA_ALANGRANT_86 [Mycobacterium phage AlanGrant]
MTGPATTTKETTMGLPVAGTGRHRPGQCSADVKALVDAIRAVGGDVQHSRNQHLRVYVDGKLVTTMPSTPSDHRALKNTIADLRRAGLALTTKGRPTHG